MESFFETSPARAYFKELERWFIERRGSPLQLSAEDYQVAKGWYRAGIPLDLVRSEIGEIIDRHRGKEEEVKRRLRYYEKAVERAFQERRRLHAPGTSSDAETLDVAGRLRSLAAALPDASWCAQTAEEVAALEGDAETVESRLAELDEALLARARDAMDEAERRRFEVELERSLARLRDRMPGGVAGTARELVERQILRRCLDLPEMSLFGLAAAAGDEPAP